MTGRTQWLDGASGAEAGALLTPALPVVRMVGERLGVTTQAPLGDGVVVLGLRTPAGLRSVDVGAEEVDTEACVDGCFLVGLAVRGSAPVTVTGLTLDGARSPGRTTRSRCRPTSPTWSRPPSTRFPLSSGVGQDGLLDGTTLETSSQVLTVDPVGTAESLPLVGPAGLMVDLASFVVQADPPPILVTSYVLARADTPAALRAELARRRSHPRAGRGRGEAGPRRHGVRPGAAPLPRRRRDPARDGARRARRQQRRAGAGPAAGRGVAAGRGCSRRALVAASLAESVVVLGSAAVAGLAAGAGALAVLLPSLELGVVEDARTPRVLPDADLGRLLAVSGGIALVLLLVAVLTSVAVVRRARASTLRETGG